MSSRTRRRRVRSRALRRVKKNIGWIALLSLGIHQLTLLGRPAARRKGLERAEQFTAERYVQLGDRCIWVLMRGTQISLYRLALAGRLSGCTPCQVAGPARGVRMAGACYPMWCVATRFIHSEYQGALVSPMRAARWMMRRPRSRDEQRCGKVSSPVRCLSRCGASQRDDRRGARHTLARHSNPASGLRLAG